MSSKPKQNKGKIVKLHDPDDNLFTVAESRSCKENQFASVFTKEDTSHMPSIDMKTEHLIILVAIDVSLENLTKN